MKFRSVELNPIKKKNFQLTRTSIHFSIQIQMMFIFRNLVQKVVFFSFCSIRKKNWKEKMSNGIPIRIVILAADDGTD